MYVHTLPYVNITPLIYIIIYFYIEEEEEEEEENIYVRTYRAIFMWNPFKTPEPEVIEVISEDLQQKFNERWIDLDARVTALEEYKRVTRRSFSAKPEELNTGEGGLLKRTGPHHLPVRS